MVLEKKPILLLFGQVGAGCPQVDEDSMSLKVGDVVQGVGAAAGSHAAAVTLPLELLSTSA